MQLVVSFVFLFASLFVPQAETEKKPFIVIELFTSEGCSSCPPADRLLSEIVDTSFEEVEVMGLSFHVDYWDYIGWKDPYANKDFTRRQRTYARKFYSSQVYTPQMVVNGKYEFVGSNRSKWKNLYSGLKKEKTEYELKLENLANSSDELWLDVSSEDLRDVILNLAVVERGLTQSVTRGENRGKELMHDNVVRSFASRQFDGEKNHFNVDLPDDLALENSSLVVYAQHKNTWEILAAKTVPLVGR